MTIITSTIFPHHVMVRDMALEHHFKSMTLCLPNSDCPGESLKTVDNLVRKRFTWSLMCKQQIIINDDVRIILRFCHGREWKEGGQETGEEGKGQREGREKKEKEENEEAEEEAAEEEEKKKEKKKKEGEQEAEEEAAEEEEKKKEKKKKEGEQEEEE
ncbi:hypothetical protein PoB_007506800 [Plakobranchus ocellatus]|uniref:Uncharacterized protein n=1 Tax=Plakobranchus ocellatus TaxID=259542 RepID=A0AAV4DWS2_9GAST|nr:hypothetical protein PoB_007506800 [Plakobranchus ocellatus]